MFDHESKEDPWTVKLGNGIFLVVLSGGVIAWVIHRASLTAVVIAIIFFAALFYEKS